ncbi:MAG TPA: hypothetical protein VJS92_00810 [Candidatus Polarisedimenticolaceae bacterium]|nr:hypothetical protein [Candidatus Polarisedimenticolaceae bacterium]
MNRLSLTVLAVTLAATAGTAQALERGAFSLDVLVDGAPLTEYAGRGTSYIEASRGREYSIRLTNHSGERVAIALSVDGLNSIDAKTTTAREAAKWILGPWESITLDGWQTSSSTARRFFFTSEQDSYGSWLGKTKNLGVISAAVFRERRPQPVPMYREDSRMAPSAPAPEERAAAGQAAPQKLSDEMAATGIGRELGHEVRRVEFDEEDRPTARLDLRYEYHDALVRLGVLPRPRPDWDDPIARRERARGFEDTGFAPDPYRRRR